MKRKEIEAFFKRRFRVYRAKTIILRVSENRLNVLKVAFIVSSVVKKNAVARNKTKRRMIEIVRGLFPSIKTGYDLVFSYKLESKKAPSFESLKNDIINLLILCGAL